MQSVNILPAKRLFINPTSAFKAVNNIGNPDLGSESATTWSTGFIINDGGFTATVDYWSYDLTDPFQTEDPNQIVNAYSAPSATNPFGQGCFDGGVGAPIVNGVPVPTPDCTELRTHIVPTGVAPPGVERIDVHVINGSDLKTSGIDATAEYDYEGVFNGVLSFGVTGTYTIEYDSDDFKDIGGVTLAPGGDFVGKMNIGTPFTSLPDLKGNAWTKYVHGPHRATLMARYVSAYDDDTASTTQLKHVDSMTYLDFYYNVSLFDDTVLLSAGVINLADEEPPLTSTNLNYDPYTADPFGRMYKIGLTYTMGGSK